MLRRHTVSQTVFIGDVEVRVEGEYTPGDPGNTYGPPERCWPPEPAEFCITEALAVLPGANGTDVEIDLMRVPEGLLIDSLMDDLQQRAIEATEEA